MTMLHRVLIANRGEIAIRIARVAHSLGMETVAIYPEEDKQSLHTQMATKAIQLPRVVAGKTPLDSYLDQDAILHVAEITECDCVHPGYGFLSENAEFAHRCTDVGIKFVGPSSNQLQLFGNKVAARLAASNLGIATVPGSPDIVSNAETAAELADSIGFPIMLKAAAGGGGRGMQVVQEKSELVREFDRCSREAESAFGDGAMFLERYLADARHIEVQILGDDSGSIAHLLERDCSIQRRNQKVIEIAPAPNLDSAVRQGILDAAIELASSQNYVNAGTFEFLLDKQSNEFYFIECNPRIQVEHTITEEISGVDLVATQFQIASGSSLNEIGIMQPRVEEPSVFSVQARVVAGSAGQISAYREPSGPGVRVDASAYSGYEVSSSFDPLIGKVIGTSKAGYEAALKRVSGALAEYQISGISTNINNLRAALSHGVVINADFSTRFLEQSDDELNASVGPNAFIQFLDQKHDSNGAAASTARAVTPTPRLNGSSNEREIVCPVESSVIEVACSVGDQVSVGQTLFVVSAMKMETNLQAPCSGQVSAIQPLSAGDVIGAQQIVALLEPSDAGLGESEISSDESWMPLLSQVHTLQDLAEKRLKPGSEDPGVVRQRSRGKLTCRERIDRLLDDGSFHEVGSVTGFASYDEDGAVMDFTPANHVGGWGTIQARTAIVCADDFTSRGGHADGAVGAKSGYLDRLSIEMRAPAIRLLDGSSGGGSVAAMVPQQKKDGESGAKESQGAIKAGRPRVAGGGGSYLPGHLGSAMFAQQLRTVPVVNMLLGSVVGIGAAKAVLGHFSVMVREISQLFVAGPPVVSHAMGYDITKEELGDWQVHCTNGSVDNLAETEDEAIAMVQRFLSYLPSSVYEVAPVAISSNTDPANRREEELLHIIPRKRTTTFDVRRVIQLLADKDSFFEIGNLWGTDQVTGFARFQGHPVGIIASDSQHVNGGALTTQGCKKLTRHIDLCDLFHIPILNLVDNPGFAVGVEHEQTGTIRAGGEWMIAFAQATVPMFTVLLRRSFGVAGNNYATPRSGPSMRVAWPAADVGGIPPEGGIEAAYKRQLAEAADPKALRAEIEARIESARGPIGPLSRFQIEEMIDPRDTRRLICEWMPLAFNIVNQLDRLGPRAIQFRP